MAAPASSGGGGKDNDSRWVPVPGARWALLLLLSINLFNYIDRQVLAAVVPEIRHEFFGTNAAPGPVVQFFLDVLTPVMGANPENALIGLLAMAFMVTYMLAAPLFGWLKVRRWWVVAFGVGIWSLASGATGLAGSFGVLLLTRCLVGVGEAAFGPVAPSMISDLYPSSKRGQVLSWFYVALPVGSALGFVLGGLVASTLGWRWAFYLVVPPGVLLALCCLFMKEPAPSKGEASAAPKHRMRWRDYKVLMMTPSYVLDTLGMALMCFAIGGIGFWMPSYIHEFRGVGTLAEVNMIFGGILVVSGLSATLIGGWVADKLRTRFSGSYFLVSGVAMLVGLPFFIASLYLPFPFAWVCVFVTCFCLFFNTGPTNTILANVTHPALRPSAFALNILVIHALGDVISPLVIGALTDIFGDMSTAFLVVSATIGGGAVLWIWGARYLERDSARALKQLDAHQG